MPQTCIISEEETSVEELFPLDWPGGMSEVLFFINDHVGGPRPLGHIRKWGSGGEGGWGGEGAGRVAGEEGEGTGTGL